MVAYLCLQIAHDHAYLHSLTPFSHYFGISTYEINSTPSFLSYNLAKIYYLI